MVSMPLCRAEIMLPPMFLALMPRGVNLNTTRQKMKKTASTMTLMMEISVKLNSRRGLTALLR